jgi:hypothetical protein
MTGRIRVPDNTAGNLIRSHSPFGPVYESPTNRQLGGKRYAVVRVEDRWECSR